MPFFAPLFIMAAIQSDRLPPANPVPLADQDTAAVMAPVNAVLAAINARDPTPAAEAIRPDALAVAAVERPDGTRTVRRTTWREFSAGIRPGPERHEERLGDPAVEVDGDVAMVWSPYIFSVDGKIDHCGTDHFSLVRENGRWQIAAITWSQRSSGCTQP